MGNGHRILIPVDFSDHSREAFELGARVARRHGVAVDALHVGEIPPYFTPEVLSSMITGSQRSIEEWITEGCQEEMQAFIESCPMASAVTLRQHVLVGDIAETIVRFAEARDHDLIVMGTHGRTGLKRISMGSIAIRVVQTATCPVLTVRLSGRIPSWLE